MAAASDKMPVAPQFDATFPVLGKGSAPPAQGKDVAVGVSRTSITSMRGRNGHGRGATGPRLRLRVLREKRGLPRGPGMGRLTHRNPGTRGQDSACAARFTP